MNYKEHISYNDVFRYYYKKSKVAGWRSPVLFMIRIVVLLSAIAEPRLISQLIELLSGSVLNTAMMRRYISLIIGIACINFIGWRCIEHLVIPAQLDVMKVIANDSFLYIQKHGSRFFSEHMSGSLLKKVKDGMHGFENLHDAILFDLVTPIGLTLGAVIVLFVQSWQVGSIMSLWCIGYIWFQASMFRKKGRIEDIAIRKKSIRTGYLADTYSNHATIEHMGSIKYEYETHNKKVSDRVFHEAKSWSFSHWIFAVSGFLMQIMFIGGILLIVYMQQQGIVSISLLILFLLYITEVLRQLWGLGNVFKKVTTALEDGREFLELLFTPHEIKNTSDAILAKRKQPMISIDAIDFGYKTDSSILNNFSLTIAPYEKIGLIGESGAGKSTLIKLLLRLYDIQQGSIKIGDKDIRDYTIDSLRSSISYVPQEPILFHRSIRENILYGKPNATHEELIEATKRARAYDFIMQLPQGFDSLVGERGVKLSGGQRQRVAIARAILHDADIIILDEATSALDSHTELDIQQAMTEVMKGKTAIVIAHRLSTVKQLDRLIVLDQGKIVEEGTHSQLMEQGGVYADTVKLQSSF